MDGILTFEKSYEERLEEFESLLFLGKDKPMSYSSVLKEWSHYLELVLDGIGWQAIWKIPRLTCEKFKIPFPSSVLIVVSDVQYSELIAKIKVLQVEDEDISIPKINYVPLWQLWPLRNQDQSIVLNLEDTAEALDKYRFFAIHIAKPWDKDEHSTDWLAEHLENRLKLHYDLKNGAIPKPLAEHIHSSINEARRLDARREYLEDELREDIDDIEMEDGELNNELSEELVMIEMKLLRLKTELELFENPLFRPFITKKQKIEYEKKQNKKQIWLTFGMDFPEKHIATLQKVRDMYPNELVSFTDCLASKIKEAGPRDTFILNECTHSSGDSFVQIEDWNILGVGDRNKIILSSEHQGLLFDFVGEHAIIENLSIEAGSAQCVMLIRRGTVVFRNCKLVGKMCSSTQQAFIVLNGAQLVLENCEITGFSDGIFCNSGSAISLTDCDIHDVHCGIVMHDKCDVMIKNTKIHSCKDYGLVMEVEQNFGESRSICSFENLKEPLNSKMFSLRGGNNGKGDALIKQKVELKAFDDLFTDPNLDPNNISLSEQEMDGN